MSKGLKTGIWVVVAILIIIVVYSFSGKDGVTPAEGESIKIGFIGPLTGDAANLGQNIKAATALSVEEVNNAGGINGRPLEVIYEDGKCNGKEAANAANKLINVDKVPVIFGGACSGETSSFTGAAEQSKTVTLSYCSSAPSITNAGDYIFRDYPSDLFQGSFAANYIFNTLAKKKVAVIYVKSDWGSGIKDVFINEFKKLGGEVVLDEGYEQTSRDLRTQLTKAKSSNPDLVYFLGYTEASIPALKQAAELKLGVPMFGGDAWDDSKIFTDSGEASNGIMYSVAYAPLNESFKAGMKVKVGGDEITACSPQAYDGIKILAQVMSKVGVDPEAIKNELYKVNYTGGVSADKISFDQNGDLIGASYIVKVVKDGKSEELK